MLRHGYQSLRAGARGALELGQRCGSTFLAWPLSRCIDFCCTSDLDIYRWTAAAPLEIPAHKVDGAIFGFVLEGSGPARLWKGPGNVNVPPFQVEPGMFFVVPARSGLHVKGGSGMIVSSFGHDPIFQLGGPIEEVGRLPYIDGCSDSLLIAPPMLGDPCLNHLHFPPAVTQTRHVHPSVRVGIVARGRGTCVSVVEESPEGERRVPLEPGTVFVIPAGLVHAFETDMDSTLDVIAYHPDSDFGPAPCDHPMINRTIVSGVSAASCPELQTRRCFRRNDA